MAKTSAERQREYRLRRNDGEGDRRINSWVTAKTDIALERMARYYGVTKREMLEKVILETDEKFISSIEENGPEWDDYFNNKKPINVVSVSNILGA